MNISKFLLAALLLNGIQTVSVAATDSGEKGAPAKPSLVTPEMMAKYAITKQTLDKKPNCNDVKVPLLLAFCERPVLTKLDGQIRTLMQDKEIRTLFKRIAPGVVGAGIYQINMVVDTILVSLVSGGAVSWLYYANRLQQLPASQW